MPLDKLTLLWEDNQLGRQHPFKFHRITATKLETGISIVLAGQFRQMASSCWVWHEMHVCTMKSFFSVYGIQGTAFIGWVMTSKLKSISLERIGLIEVRCWICQSELLYTALILYAGGRPVPSCKSPMQGSMVGVSNSLRSYTLADLCFF